MTPVDKALLVSAEQILRINGYEAEAGAVGRVGENLESAERDAGRWRPQLVDGLDCGGAHQGADEVGHAAGRRRSRPARKHSYATGIDMGARIDNMKRLAERRGWQRVALVLTVGWIVLAWVWIGKALTAAGNWMQDIVGA